MALNMSNVWIAVLLLGIVCVSSGSAASGYSVISTNIIRPGQSSYKVTVSVYGVSNVNAAASLTNAKGVQFPNTEKTVSGIGDGQAKEIKITNVPTDLKVNDVMLKVVLTGGLSVTNSTKLTVDRKSMSIYIQTDKRKYKPKDTLKFRIFATDANLKPLLKPLDITLKDTKNDVFQWLQVSGKAEKNGVLSLEYIIPEFSNLGDWNIAVKSGDNSVMKKFTVEKYVLPRFEVKVDSESNFFLLGSKDNKITATGTYTFGEKVLGEAEITVKYAKYNWVVPTWTSKTAYETAVYYKGIKLIDGKASVKLSLDSKDVALVKIFAVVIEASTGEKMNTTKEIKVYEKTYKMTKNPLSSNSFRPGLNYNGMLTAVQSDDSPLAEAMKVLVKYTPCPPNKWGGFDCYGKGLTSYILPEITVPANGDGLVRFAFPTKAEFRGYRIKATIGKDKSPSVDYQITKFETKAKDISIELRLVSDINDVKVGRVIEFVASSVAEITSFTFVVLSKGSNVYKKAYQIPKTTAYTFSVLLTREMAPSAKFFVSYVASTGRENEFVGDYMELIIGGSMENAVSVKFNKPQAKLGEVVSVIVNSAPKSYVGLLCVDKSVILLATGNDITKDDVLDEQGTYGTKKDTYNDDVFPFFRMCGMIPSLSGSTMQMIGDLNIAVMTGAFIAGRYSQYYGGGGGGIIMEDRIAFAGAGGPVLRRKGDSSGTQNSKTPEKPRVDFPETWMWLDKTAGSNGVTSFAAKTPDTITTWVCSAFALDMTKGLGIAPDQAKLIAKKDFFAQPLLPYSIKNGEAFILKVLVHQYTGKKNLQVTVTLPKTNLFEASDVFTKNPPPSWKEQTLSKTFKMVESTYMVSFHIRVPRVGDINITVEAKTNQGHTDGVKKLLRVKPQGVKRTVAIPTMVSQKKGDAAFKKDVPIKVPTTGVVAGSTYVEVAAIGDLLGPSLKNIEGLIRMPYGCGEQNMINFAPAMFIYRYLSGTGKLETDLKDKLLKVMLSGYTRELTYQHSAPAALDKGGFSAFGGRGGRTEASTWLTAFVVKCFAQASKYIPISNTGLDKAIEWLLKLQQKDGSFEKRGNVIHKDLEGGSSEGPALTTYVVISMTEHKDGFGTMKKTVADKTKLTLDYLKKYAESIMKKIGSGKPSDRDLYDLTIIAYALSLSDNSYADDILAKLDAIATVEDGQKYWKMASPVTCTNSYRCYSRKPNPSEVEIAAYALLTYLKRNKCSAGCSFIVKWMSSKRQETGSFCSTKDTVLGLQAISAFAQAQAEVAPNLSVGFKYSGQTADWTVTSKDSKILKEKLFDYKANQNVSVDVGGVGTGIVMVNYWYNEVEITEYTPKLNIKPTITCEQLKNKDQVCTMQVCVSQVDDLIKGMSILESSCLSGFVPTDDAVTVKGKTKMTLNKYETDEDKIVAYLNDVSSTSECLIMKCLQKQIVTTFKPAVVSFADYYSTDVRKEVVYSAPASLVGEDDCKACGASCGCPRDGTGNTATSTTFSLTLLTFVSALLVWRMQ